MRANAAAAPALNPTCRFRGDTLQDHQCQLEKTGEAVKYVLVYLVLSLGMCELSKKGTLCGETLGPEKGSATLENIDCAMGLRSAREFGTATSAAKSEHQAEIYADYTYAGYMRMQMLRYVYQRISWYHLATDDRGRADLVLKVPSVRRTARRDIVLRLIHHPTQHSGVTVRPVQKAELRAINRGVTRPPR